MDPEIMLDQWHRAESQIELAERELTDAMTEYRVGESETGRLRLSRALAQRARARDALVAFVQAVDFGLMFRAGKTTG